MKRIWMCLTMVMAAFPAMAQTVSQTQTTTSTTTNTVAAPMTLSEPDYGDPFQVSVQGGALWSTHDKSRLRSGSAVFGRLTYDLTPNVAVGGESGGIHFEDEQNGTKYGHLNGVPAMGDLVLKMPMAATDNRLVPYLYGGAGVIIWSYDKSGYSDTIGLKASSRTHFAAKPGAGLEFYLTRNVALFVEASYLYSKPFELKGGTSSPPSGKIKVDSIYGGGGLKIAF